MKEKSTADIYDVDTVNFTDGNNLKQGKWIEVENGKIIKEDWYKDGKVIDKP